MPELHLHYIRVYQVREWNLSNIFFALTIVLSAFSILLTTLCIPKAFVNIKFDQLFYCFSSLSSLWFGYVIGLCYFAV